METETTNTPSAARLALRYGLYAGLATVIVSTIIQLADLAQNKAVGYGSLLLTAAILAAATYLAVKEFRTRNQGFVTLGQSVGLGALLAAVAGVIGSIFSFVYVTFIDSGAMEKSFDAQREQFEKQGMSDEQIEQAVEMGRKFAPVAFALAPFMYALVGVVLGLIIGAILKKERDVFSQ